MTRALLALSWFALACTDQVGLTVDRATDAPDGGPAPATSIGELRWAQTFGDMKEDGAWSVAWDGDDAIIVTGSEGVDFDPRIAGHAFLQKMDAVDGETLWRQISTSSEEGVVADLRLALDDTGRSLVGTSFWGTLELGADAVQEDGCAATVLATFDTDGTPELTLSVPGELRGIATSLDGTIYTGATEVQPCLEGVEPDPADVRQVVSRLTLDGESIWRQDIGSIHEVFIMTLTGAADGDLIVSGTAHADGQIGGLPIAGRGTYGQQPFMARLAPDGTARWVRSFPVAGEGAHGQIMDVTLAEDGSILAVGQFNLQIAFDYHVLTTPDWNDEDLFVLRLSPAGSVLDVAQLKDRPDAWAIAAEASGDALIGGQGFAAHLDSSGELIAALDWSVDSRSNMTQVADAAVSPSGAIALVGQFEGAIDFGAGPIKNVEAAVEVPFNGFIAVFDAPQ